LTDGAIFSLSRRKDPGSSIQSGGKRTSRAYKKPVPDSINGRIVL
jgi:hypothetical protein